MHLRKIDCSAWGDWLSSCQSVGLWGMSRSPRACRRLRISAAIGRTHYVEGMGKMHSRSSTFFLGVIGAALLLLSSRIGAVPINYGNFNGTNVMYLNVTEDSSTDPTPLFGAPTVSDDALSFNPSGFGATSSGGGTDLTDGTLATTIMTTGTKRI